ncbi:MAG: TrmB family transcriptional regulator [Thermoprotei archaeon]|nr:TrmB family transcriptional regulator [Thermoprotei archaeon]
MEEKQYETLLKFGLTPYESKAYLALLKVGEDTARGIVERTGIPDSHIYKVLEGLLKKGLVTISGSKPRTYAVVEPAYMLRVLKEEVIQELEKGYRALLKQAAEKRRDGISVFLSRRGFMMALRRSLELANEDIRLLITDEWVFKEIRQEVWTKAREGRKVKLLLNAKLGFVEEIPNENFEVRYAHVIPPMNMVIVNGKTVFVSMFSRAGDHFLGVEVVEKDLVENYKTYFEHLWIDHFIKFLRKARAKRIEEIY